MSCWNLKRCTLTRTILEYVRCLLQCCWLDVYKRQAYIMKYNMVQDLVPGGTFLLNCSWDMEGLEKHLPGQAKRDVYKRQQKSVPAVIQRCSFPIVPATENVEIWVDLFAFDKVTVCAVPARSQ